MTLARSNLDHRIEENPSFRVMSPPPQAIIAAGHAGN